MDAGAKPVDRIGVGDVDRHQGRRAAGRADFVVDLLEAADGARQQQYMGALARKGERDRAPDAARRTGDDR